MAWVRCNVTCQSLTYWLINCRLTALTIVETVMTIASPKTNPQTHQLSAKGLKAGLLGHFGKLGIYCLNFNSWINGFVYLTYNKVLFGHWSIYSPIAFLIRLLYESLQHFLTLLLIYKYIYILCISYKYFCHIRQYNHV